MSWDVHGQPLAAGHCEVHPSEPEPYPCAYCREAEFAQDEEQARAQEEAEAEAYEQWLSQQHEDQPPW